MNAQKSFPLLTVKEARALNAIEVGILPLCDAINSVENAITIASCEGHGYKDRFWRKGFMFRPYVLFSAAESVARLMAWHIDNCIRTERTFYVWKLTGYFHPKDEKLVWIIEPSDIRLPSKWDRQQINSDISSLALLFLDVLK